MKYTIMGFNQTKLCEYGLDTNDAMILRWLVDFASTGKMKKTVEDKEIYYLVSYEAVIKEFPVMGINTVKAIANRFEKYVNCGLLKKIVKRGGMFNGAAVCFCLTSLLTDMMYDSTDISEKKAITEAQRNVSSVKKSDSNQTSYRKSEKSDSNLDSYRKKDNLDSNQTSYRSESDFLSTGTEVPVALNNQSINSSRNSSSSSEKKDLLTKALNYFVDVHFFSEDFVPKLLQKLDEFNIPPEDYTSFAQYAYDKAQKSTKDKSKLMAYMYASCADNFFLAGFLDNKKIKDEYKANNYMDCPVCGTNHLKFEYCPTCELKNPKSQAEVYFRKAIFKLPQKSKTDLQNDLDTLFNKYTYEEKLKKRSQYLADQEAVYQKYCPISHEDYKEIFGA